MAKGIPETALSAILAAVQSHPGGASLAQLRLAIAPAPKPRTLQFRLKYLVDAGRLIQEGDRRAARYKLPDAQPAPVPEAPPAQSAQQGVVIPLSAASTAIRRYLSQPPAARKPAGYNRQFLDS